MSEIIIEKIVNYGVLGAVLIWFMFRFEGIIKANTDAVNALTTVIAGMKEK